MGDCGINSGGAAIDVPMLVQPPSMATGPEALRTADAPDDAGLDAQLGGAEVALGVVDQGGAETPLADPVFVLGLVVEVANGFDEETCWFAARMPASTPSRSAVPVSVNALRARSGIEVGAAIGVIG